MNQIDVHVHRKLSGVWNLLLNSRLVKSKIVDTDSVAYFAKMLKRASAANAVELGFAKLVRGFYCGGKAAFIKNLKNTNWIHFVLWTEGRAIVNELGVDDLIYLKWSGRSYRVQQKTITEPVVQDTTSDDTLIQEGVPPDDTASSEADTEEAHDKPSADGDASQTEPVLEQEAFDEAEVEELKNMKWSDIP